MRVRINEMEVIDAETVEIITGPNYLHITADENHPERNFDIQMASSQCDSCEAFYDESCMCEL